MLLQESLVWMASEGVFYLGNILHDYCEGDGCWYTYLNLICTSLARRCIM